MVLVLIAVVVVAAVVAAVVLRGRPRGTDIDSVRSYHAALGTLEHLSERNGPTTLRVVSPPDRPVDPQPRGDGEPARVSRPVPVGGVPPVPVRGNDEFPDPGTPLVFDDARPRDSYRGEPFPEGVPAHRVDRAQRHALDSMNHRPRRGLYLLVVAVVIVGFGVLAYSGSKRSTGSGHASASASTTAPARSGSSSSAPARPKHTGTTARTPPTTTTLPSSLVAVTSTDTTATYTVPSATYTLTVTTTSPSWVQVTTVATGSTLWAGTVPPGAVQVIQASGEVTVQIGLPSVDLVVGRIPVVLPTLIHTPFVATFQPAAAAAPATASSSITVPVTTTTTPG